MAEIFIDGIKYQVADGQNLLQASLSLGLNLPYFCWHPAMGSVGACRQCAVIQYRDENDTRGRLVMACLTPATNGTRISINSVDARTFRAKVIEWLMVNHPHDCPVCDEGGECHLQDMTVMTGHNYRRFRFQKRTHHNQYLGPFVNHEMNRCIACYRCVRFYRDYAVGDDLNVFAAHDSVYFGRQEDGVLESEFAGNLVEVCPTGVFTDKTLKHHYARKWDLQTAPSICHHCGLGCNIIGGERYGTMRRILNRYNSEVNGYFICDRGRFGYEFVESDKRIRKPLLRNEANDSFDIINRAEAQTQIADIISRSQSVIGIGSPRASLESNYALRALVGVESFFSGMGARENKLISQILSIQRKGMARSASLHDVELADAVLILGEDLHNTAPMMALSVIQASHNQPMKKAFKIKIPKWDDISIRELIQNDKGPLFNVTPQATKLDKVMRGAFRASPDDIARIGFAIAHAIDPKAPEVGEMPDELRSAIGEIATELKNAERPLILSGMSLFSDAIIGAAANIASALCADGKPAEICYILPECNSLGAGFIEGVELEKVFEMADRGEIDTAIIVENDLYRRADMQLIDQFLSKCKNVIVIDHLQNQTTAKADIVLPAATFAEGNGTLINNEGRIQRFFQIKDPNPDLYESWRWIRDIMAITNPDESNGWNNLDDISNAMFNDIPSFGGSIQVAPPADFRIENLKIARKIHRNSGRTAQYADVNVHEPMPPPDNDSALNFTMEGYHGKPPGALNTNYWAPGWNSVQSLNKYQKEIAGPLLGGDPGVRLIEANKDVKASYFDNIPPKFESRKDQWLIVPLYHIYGSEELSSEADGISQLLPDAYVALNPSEASKIESVAGGTVSLSIGDKMYQLQLLVRDGLPDGVAGLPVGLQGLLGMTLPDWGRIG